MRRTIAGASVILVFLLAYELWPDSENRHAPGILAGAEPEQRPLAAPLRWTRDRYDIGALAAFRIRALVLGKERYWIGRETDLSPLDLALGWGPMSDQKIVDQFDITQGGRWYHWRSARLPISTAEVITHSANMHMIPATPDVEEELKDLRRGDVVDLSGYLVEVKGNDGWSWRSSLRRDDTGDGSCELVWVERLAVVE